MTRRGSRRRTTTRTRNSWREVEGVFEDAPFPIRIQGAADLEAARFARCIGLSTLSGSRLTIVRGD